MRLAAVDRFIGQPWSYPDNDCWQVFRRAAWAVFRINVLEVAVPAVSDPAAAAQLFDEYRQRRPWERVDDLEPGCAVLFRHKQTGHVMHIGLHLTDGDILHCAQRLNGRVDNIKLLQRLFGSAEYYRHVPDYGI